MIIKEELESDKGRFIMLTIKAGIIISGILALAGIVQWTASKIRLTREGYLLDCISEAGEQERERLAAEKRQREREEEEQAGRVFGLDFLITHGTAFGGFSATGPDGKARKGSVALDQIMMYGRQSSGRDYTYYIEDQGLVICAGEDPDHLLIRSQGQPFEIREAGLGRDQGLVTDRAVIEKDLVYYIILESHHEISIRASRGRS